MERVAAVPEHGLRRAAEAAGRAVATALSLVAIASAGAACTLSSGNEPRTYKGTNTRPDLALRTASEDLACPVASMLIATTLERRFSNTSAARYVIDGCGERALYVEQCEISDAAPSGEGFHAVDGGSSVRCRFLIVSRVAIPSRTDSPKPGAPAPAPLPTSPAGSASAAPPATPLSL